jgi:protein TonB
VIQKNILRFSAALSAATATHLSVLAYTMSQPLSGPALIAGNSFSVQLGPIAETTPSSDTKPTKQAAADPEPQPTPIKPDSTPAPEPNKEAAPPPPDTTLLPKPSPSIEREPALETETVPGQEEDSGNLVSDSAHLDSSKDLDQPASADTGSEKPSDAESASNEAETTTAGEAPSDTLNNANSGAPGNAAESNYKGLVMQHLSRQRRPRASSPGSAFVEFRISPRGTVKSISISRSSGSSRFDREAIIVVKKAAPYPKPPVGVNTMFTVEIAGT